MHSTECKRRQLEWERKNEEPQRRLTGKQTFTPPELVPPLVRPPRPQGVSGSSTDQAIDLDEPRQPMAEPMTVDQTVKRTAEQDVEDLRADSISLVATKGPPWYDTATGEELNTEKVKLGMQRERKDFHSFQVFDEASEDAYAADQLAGKKPELVNSGWVLRKKPNDTVRARCVATQVNYGSLLDTFAATPTSVAIRILLAWALRCKLDVWIGASRKWMLYGPHKEPKYIQRHLVEILTLKGWKRLKCEPQLWHHPEYEHFCLLIQVIFF